MRLTALLCLLSLAGTGPARAAQTINRLLLDFLGQAMHTHGNAVKLTVPPIAGVRGKRRNREI